MSAKEELEAKRAIENEHAENLKAAAEWLGEELAKSEQTFMLVDSMSLTVVPKEHEGGVTHKYAKQAHVGGEDFKPVRAYVGKRDGVIIVFEPVMASDYTEMEMPLEIGKQKLSGLEGEVRRIGFEAKLVELAKERIAKREALAAQERSTNYGDQYGGW